MLAEENSLVPTSLEPRFWNRLHHVSLRGNTSDISAVITHCTSAVTLQLSPTPYPPLHREPQATHYLPELKGLSFHCHADGLRVLREINCPNLEVLQLGLHRHDGDWCDYSDVFDEGDEYVDLWEHLLDFLDNPDHKLRVLQIEDKEGYMSPHRLYEFFVETDRVTKDLYGLEVTLEATDEILKAIELIRVGLNAAESLVAGHLLERHERTIYDEEYVHIGWVWETEFEPYVDERRYLPELKFRMEGFEEFSRIKAAWFDEDFDMDGDDEYDEEEDEDDMDTDEVV
ncbi:hypothetical protein AN958_07740 [Leucoagaricus sp. SymC.cos]|nr:hypothetical protein AN958_07740 [Leucoagaricus sp. SymC.cos]